MNAILERALVCLAGGPGRPARPPASAMGRNLRCAALFMLILLCAAAPAAAAHPTLAGQVAEQIPQADKGPHPSALNSVQGQRAEMDPAALSPDNSIIHPPDSLYPRHKTLVWAVLGGIIGLHFIIFSLVLNILKRRRAESKIKKSERRFNTILNTTKEGFFEIDLNAVVKDINPEMGSMIGLPREDIIGRQIVDFVTLAAAHKIQTHLQRVGRGHRSTFEVALARPDQTQLPCLFSMTPIVDEAGSCVGCFAMVTDITDLKSAQAALQESEETLRATFESTEDGLLVVAHDGRITHMNTKLIEMWELPPNRLATDKGPPIMDLIMGRLEYPEEFRAKIQQLQDSAAKSLETIRLKDGRMMERFSCPLMLEGKAAGRAWSFRDITVKKHLESQLIQAQKMEAIGNLAGGIAHDFNNRLQTISGYTQLLLLDKQRSEPDRIKLLAIERSAKRSCELIDQLLLFSSKIESKLTPIDLNHEVRQIKKLLERTIPRMVRIELKLEDHLGIIKADPSQIEQVIMNLSINSSHAMTQGGRLTIATASVTLDEAYCKRHVGLTPCDCVRLSISDTGVGMDKETLEHIFEPFFTTKPLGRGTGLGLAMVHGIIKNHGGHITCRSRLGEGTCFEIYFPVLAISSDTAAVGLPNEPDLPCGRETILIVEDDEDNLEVARSILQHFGYCVVGAASGEQALELFSDSSRHFDLMLLDLNMPGAGGNQILDRVLKIRPATKVLIASGYSGLAVKNALRAGAAGYIRKPYQMADLLRHIRTVLNGDSSG